MDIDVTQLERSNNKYYASTFRYIYIYIYIRLSKQVQWEMIYSMALEEIPCKLKIIFFNLRMGLLEKNMEKSFKWFFLINKTINYWQGWLNNFGGLGENFKSGFLIFKY